MLLDDDLPELDFEQQLRGHGVLSGAGGELRVPAFSIRRPKYGDSDGWTVVAHPDASYQEISLTIAGGDEPIRLVGKSERGRPVRIPEIVGWSFTHRRLEGNCYELEVGPDALSAEPESQYVSVSFTPTSIAQPEVPFPTKSYTGEIRGDRNGNLREPFSISTVFGPAEFSLRYDWENANLAGEKVPVRIPSPKLFLEVERADCTDRPIELARGLKKDLEYFSRLLSFLSRRDVRWGRIYVLSRWDEGESPAARQETELWQASGGRDRPAYLNGFVVPGRMEPGDLQRLLDSFRSLEYRDEILHAIGFLIGGVAERYVEVMTMNVFTALEATVSGFCQAEDLEFIVDAQIHNELREDLRDRIRGFVAGDDRVPDGKKGRIQNALNRKMAGSHTRRRSFPDRVVDTVEETGASWRDLWPDDVSLRSAIRKAYDRRSSLIHGGIHPSDIPTHVDIFRIHALTERIIYNLFDGESNWVAPFAYDHCGRLSGFGV